MSEILFASIIAILEVGLGIIVLLQKPRSLTNQTFFCMSLSWGIWTSLIGLMTSSVIIPSDVIRIIASLMFSFGMLITSSFLYFSWNFPVEDKKITNNKILWLIAPTLIIFFLILFTKILVKELYPENIVADRIEFDSRGFAIYFVLAFTNLTWASLNLFRKYFRSSGLFKQQISYIGIGFGITIIFTIISHVILPMFGNSNYIFLAPLYPIAVLVTTSYAILCYRLLDIPVVIKRTTIYLVLVGVITAIYSLLLILPQMLIGTITKTQTNLLLVIASLILAFTIMPLREWLDNVTDKMFYQKKYDYFKVLEELSRKVSTVIKIDDLLDLVNSALSKALHLDRMCVYLLGQPGNANYSCVLRTGRDYWFFPGDLDRESPLLEYIGSEKKPVLTGEFKHKYGHLIEDGKVEDETKAEIYKMLSKTLDIELVIPLWLKDTLIGFIGMGKKLSGDQYSDRDLTLLETIANQMVIVLENTRLYEQMLNNERLTVLGAMSASIAHEVRNPLASIKTFVQMMPGKLDNLEFRQRFFEIVPVEIDRLTRITEDLLTFARPSPPTKTPGDIRAIVQRVLTLMANQLRKKNIAVDYVSNDVPMVPLDGQQLTQVFMNLILNAAQASKPGTTLVIRCGVRGDASGGMKNVYVDFIDQGTGIKPKDLPNIFQPFFTTKHEGTGLGLATSKRIVEAHQGEILVHSEEGKGSTFTVLIPIAAPRDAVGV